MAMTPLTGDLSPPCVFAGYHRTSGYLEPGTAVRLREVAPFPGLRPENTRCPPRQPAGDALRRASVKDLSRMWYLEYTPCNAGLTMLCYG